MLQSLASPPSVVFCSIRMLFTVFEALGAVNERITLSQFAWPCFEAHVDTILARHSQEHRELDFEDFETRILHCDVIEKFMALVRANVQMNLNRGQRKVPRKRIRTRHVVDASRDDSTALEVLGVFAAPFTPSVH